MDRVRPMKIEKISGGGSQDDIYPHDLDPNEDALDARGLVIQSDSSNDETVVVSRDESGNMTFKDSSNLEKTLTEVLGGVGSLSEEAHKALRQLIHFMDDGPAEGYGSGAYREVTGGVKPTSITWYTDDTKADKIVEKVLTWTGVNVTTIQWAIYDDDGSTVLASVTDVITYSGIFETSRARMIVVN